MRLHLCRRFSYTFSSLLFVAALGCGDDRAAPTSPESQAVPATGALTVTLSFRQVSAGFWGSSAPVRVPAPRGRGPVPWG